MWREHALPKAGHKEVEVGDLWWTSDNQVMICENIYYERTMSNIYSQETIETPQPNWVCWNRDGDEDEPYKAVMALIRPWSICASQLDTTLDMVAKLGIETLSKAEVRHYNMLIHELRYVVENTQFDTPVPSVRRALKALRAGEFMFYDEEIVERLYDQLLHKDRWVVMAELTSMMSGGVTGATGPTEPYDGAARGSATPMWKVDRSTTDNSTHNNITWINGYTQPHDNLIMNEAPRDSPLSNFDVASAGPMCDYRTTLEAPWSR